MKRKIHEIMKKPPIRGWPARKCWTVGYKNCVGYKSRKTPSDRHLDESEAKAMKGETRCTAAAIWWSHTRMIMPKMVGTYWKRKYLASPRLP